MCFSSTFSLCTPSFVTIKAFANTDPFGLQWSKLKPEGEVVPVELALMGSLYSSAVLASGSKQPNESSNATNEGALLTRNVSTGADVELLQATPQTGPLSTARHWFAVDAQSADAWMMFRASNNHRAFYFNEVSGRVVNQDNPAVHLSTHFQVWPSMCHQDSMNLIAGPVRPVSTDYVLGKWDTSGALTGSLQSSALSVTGGRAISYAFPIETANASSPILIYGAEGVNGNRQYRRLWTYDASLSLGAAATVSPLTTEHYLSTTSGSIGTLGLPADSLADRPYTPNGSWAFLITRQTTQSGLFNITHTFRLKGITLGGTPAESWSKVIPSLPAFGSARDAPRVLAADNSNVYITGVPAGNDATGVTALSVTDGSVVWWANSVRASGGSIALAARPLTAGIAFYGGHGIKLFEPATGELLATFDTPTVYDIAEIGTRIFAVGTRRPV